MGEPTIQLKENYTGEFFFCLHVESESCNKKRVRQRSDGIDWCWDPRDLVEVISYKSKGRCLPLMSR
jgi:hypothetical protein